ncbi:hypothetical protein ACFTAO_06015 [Paenibacillus rhizoplanae]
MTPAFIEAWLVEGRSTVPWAVLSEGGELPNGRDLAGEGILPSIRHYRRCWKRFSS